MITALFLGSLSLGISKQHETDHFYQFISTAQSKGEIKITPLIIKDDSRSLKKNYHYASVAGINFSTFKPKKDYIVKVKTDSNILRVELSDNSDVLNKLQSADGIEIEENFILDAQSLTKESDLDKIQKYLFTQNNKITIADQSQVKVAIIDSGLYDLQSHTKKIVINKREQQGLSNYDDDKNGYIDDVYGWSAISESGDFTDTNGHGTHLAGIIMAISQSLENPEALQIIPIQVLDEQNQVKLSNLLVGLDYAKKRQADIVNLSIGTKSESQILSEAIEELTKEGIVVVASAGNNSEEYILNPASHPDVIAISALNKFNRKSVYSNYGEEADFSVKGGFISLGDSTLQYQAGTSQAAALFSGIFALERLQNPQRSNQEILEVIKEKSLGTDDKFSIGHKLKLKKHLDQSTNQVPL